MQCPVLSVWYKSLSAYALSSTDMQCPGLSVWYKALSAYALSSTDMQCPGLSLVLSPYANTLSSVCCY
eukprot:313086-Rhodomonas_salina.1